MAPLLRKGVPTRLTAGALVLGISWLAWRDWPTDPDLLRTATRLCPAQLAGPATVAERSVWNSDGTVLETMWAKGINTTGPVVGVKLLDPRLNASHELSTALRTELQRGGGFVGPSPDHKWGIVWRRQGRDASITAVRLDGGGTIAWPVPRRGLQGCGWMPESKCFVLVYSDEVARLHVDSPGAVERTAIPKLPDSIYECGFLRDGPLLFPLRAWSRPTDKVAAYLLDLKGTRARLRSISMRLPAPRMVKSVYASPRGDRLLWCLQTPPMPDWMESVLAPFRRRAQWIRQEAWVSRADGTGMREIGAANGHGFHVTGWTPDGRHVTFVYDRFLYTAPKVE